MKRFFNANLIAVLIGMLLAAGISASANFNRHTRQQSALDLEAERTASAIESDVLSLITGASLAAQAMSFDENELGPVLRRFRELQRRSASDGAHHRDLQLHLDFAAAFEGQYLISSAIMPDSGTTAKRAALSARAVIGGENMRRIERPTLIADNSLQDARMGDSTAAFWLLVPIKQFYNRGTRGVLGLRFHFSNAHATLEQHATLGQHAAQADAASSVGDAAELTLRLTPRAGQQQDSDKPGDTGTTESLFGGTLHAERNITLADRTLVVSYRQRVTGISGLDLTTGAPAMLIGLLLTLLVYRLVRAEKNRTASFARSHEDSIQQIAAKERALEDSEARFKHLAESTNAVPWTADMDGQRFTYIGPQIEKITGYPASAWYASGFWPQHIHPADRQRIMSSLHEMKLGTYSTLEYRLRASDGRVLHVRNMLTLGKLKRDGQSKAPARTVAQGFLLDISEMKMAEETLREAQEKAEEANRIKSEFLANMSHELRTPLNSVIGFSEIMKEQVFGPLDAQYRDYAQSIYTSGRHLLDLINDVLDLSKIEAGRIELSEEISQVDELLSTCSKLMHERIAKAGLHYRVDIEPDLPPMLMDERRVRQVVLNLLSNAAKFTPPGGTVSLMARLEPKRGILISVRDTGVGMSAEEVPKALSKFGQINGDLTRQHDGTGLGLPIAKSLMEMHGGSLTIASQKGKGTEVQIMLPIARIRHSNAA
ncbi:MAG: ATP-binding protein [Neomegalonema sp.]|nr:ATP-binding protein [Neomegalonema sp.]